MCLSRNSRQESCMDGLVGGKGKWLGSSAPPSTEAEPYPRSPLCTQGWSSPTSCAGGLAPATLFNQGRGFLLGAGGPLPGALSPCLDSCQGSRSRCCCCRDAQAWSERCNMELSLCTLRTRQAYCINAVNTNLWALISWAGKRCSIFKAICVCLRGSKRALKSETQKE